MLVSASFDVALVLDRHGVILDSRLRLPAVPPETGRDWVGRAWGDVVTVASRAEVSSLLRDAAAGAAHLPCHVDHSLGQGQTLPILYVAVPMGAKGRIVAFGRDLRDQASTAQRLVAAQQALERDQVRLRQMRSRERLLFDTASDAILIIDPIASTIVDANQAAIDMLGLDAHKHRGQAFPSGLTDEGQRAVAALLARVRGGGRGDELLVHSGHARADLQVLATLMADDGGQHILVRMRALRNGHPTPSPDSRNAIAKVIDRLPDGIVVTDLDGQVHMANPAFVELVQVHGDAPLRGRSLDRWLGQPGVDLSVMLATLRCHGTIRLFMTRLRGELGEQTEVEVSGAVIRDGELPSLCFAVRPVGGRVHTEDHAGQATPRSVEQLLALVGRKPLRDLVRESTELIEGLCIESALKLSRDNRAAAAAMLGISRQSLYVKLHRYDLGELEPTRTSARPDTA